MNPKILASLEHLKQLQTVTLLPYQLPDQNKLLWRYGIPGFHCLNTGEVTGFLPEEACFADFEWLCSHEGATYLTPELSAVTIRKPFCGQFIGLSGNSYIWFQPGNYAKPETLQYCSVGKKVSTFIVHNTAADRPMITESHTQNTNDGPNFFCTMSAHLLCAGVSSQQSWQYTMGSDKPRTGGLKNLVDVYNFWSQTEFPAVLELGAQRGTVKAEAKAIRDVFYKGSLKTVLGLLEELVSYGMADVEKTLAIYRNLYPAWVDALPSRESQYFYLKRAKVNYALAPDFVSWFYSTEVQYQTIQSEINTLVQLNNQTKLAEFKAEVATSLASFNPTLEALSPYCLKGKPGSLAKKWQSQPPYLLAQELHLETQSVINQWQQLYNAGSWKINSNGSPLWAKTESSCDSPISQLLLDAEYIYSSDLPAATVMFDKVKKFVYYDNKNAQVKITEPKKSIATKDNCGSILAKGFIPLWENRVLSCKSDDAKVIVNLMAQVSYWTSVRSRLAELVVLAAPCHGDRDHNRNSVP
jgi:DNA mitochondrial polymerase exonuclease domain